MLWLLIAVFLCWLIWREFYFCYVPPKGYDRPNDKVSIVYVLILAVFAAAFAYLPYRAWQFERFLTKQARILSESPKATVHCNTVVDAFFDPNSMAAGHANFETGKIVFQYSWCEQLRGHLRSPEKPTEQELFSVQIFAHEAMHIRGERNEAKTECQALQRYSRAAQMLGVPARIAKKNATAYFRQYYLHRSEGGPMQQSYFSADCAPGGALDERLPDATWMLD
jgi:hypothetical protein